VNKEGNPSSSPLVPLISFISQVCACVFPLLFFSLCVFLAPHFTARPDSFLIPQIIFFFFYIYIYIIFLFTNKKNLTCSCWFCTHEKGGFEFFFLLQVSKENRAFVIFFFVLPSVQRNGFKGEKRAVMWLATWPSHTHTHANSVEQKWEHTYVYLSSYTWGWLSFVHCVSCSDAKFPSIYFVSVFVRWIFEKREKTHTFANKTKNQRLSFDLLYTFFEIFFFPKNKIFIWSSYFLFLCVPSYRNCYTDFYPWKIVRSVSNGKKILVRVSFILLGVFSFILLSPLSFSFFF